MPCIVRLAVVFPMFASGCADMPVPKIAQMPRACVTKYGLLFVLSLVMGYGCSGFFDKYDELFAAEKARIESLGGIAVLVYNSDQKIVLEVKNSSSPIYQTRLVLEPNTLKINKQSGPAVVALWPSTDTTTLNQSGSAQVQLQGGEDSKTVLDPRYLARGPEVVFAAYRLVPPREGAREFNLLQPAQIRVPFDYGQLDAHAVDMDFLPLDARPFHWQDTYVITTGDAASRMLVEAVVEPVVEPTLTYEQRYAEELGLQFALPTTALISGYVTQLGAFDARERVLRVCEAAQTISAPQGIGEDAKSQTKRFAISWTPSGFPSQVIAYARGFTEDEEKIEYNKSYNYDGSNRVVSQLVDLDGDAVFEEQISYGYGTSDQLVFQVHRREFLSPVTLGGLPQTYTTSSFWRENGEPSLMESSKQAAGVNESTKTEYFYNKDGQLIRVEKSVNNEVRQRDVYQLNENGLPFVITEDFSTLDVFGRYVTPDSEPENKISLTYNNFGYVVLSERDDGIDEIIDLVQRTDYDNLGRWLGGLTDYGANGANVDTYTFSYDGNHLRIDEKWEFASAGEHKKYRQHFQRDGHGNTILSEIVYDSPLPGLLSSSAVYEFDDEDRVVLYARSETDFGDSFELQEKVTTSYNQNGDLELQEQDTDGDGLIDIREIRTYNDPGQILRIDIGHGVFLSEVPELSYHEIHAFKYGLDGKLDARSKTIEDEGSPSTTSSIFEYDLLGRVNLVVHRTEDAGTVLLESLKLDYSCFQ